MADACAMAATMEHKPGRRCGAAGPADRPHEVRRHGPVGRRSHDRQGRHGRSLARHAREPDHLADQGLGHGPGTRVGQGQTDVVTRKDLIIRMEAPRFFVQTDEVVLSAVVHNYLKTKKKRARSRLRSYADGRSTASTSRRCTNRLAAAGTAVRWAARIARRNRCDEDRRNRPQRRGPRRLARQSARRGRSGHPHEGPHRRRIGRDGAEVPLLHPRDAQDGFVLRRRFARTTRAASSRSTCRRSAGRSSRGSKSATRPRWPARWSMPCPTWSIIPTAAPSRR